MKFPIDLGAFKALKFSTSRSELIDEQAKQLRANIEVVRDSIVFFTAYANTKGLGGHTGGAYDIVPELLIIDGFMKGSDMVYPVYFDEAGHRVAIQYMMAVLNGYKPPESLLHYREFGSGLYGHPERDDEQGVFFSSGRLGHMWSYVNGVAAANPDKTVVMFGSDGSQQEGGDAEAARYAVAQKLNVKLLIDDNDVTIAGHPSDYMKGFSVESTLKGHGVRVDTGSGESLSALYQRIQNALITDGPVALINKRKMAVGIPGIEGLPKGHDVIPVDFAITYLKEKGWQEAVKALESSAKQTSTAVYLGSTKDKAKNRDNFGKIVCDILEQMPDRKARVLVVDSDLEGSCGLHHIRKTFPEVYVSAGIMERNNFSVAAGFGAEKGKQGIFGTFSAFLEMVVSEITMARLNRANVLWMTWRTTPVISASTIFSPTTACRKTTKPVCTTPRIPTRCGRSSRPFSMTRVFVSCFPPDPQPPLFWMKTGRRVSAAAMHSCPARMRSSGKEIRDISSPTARCCTAVLTWWNACGPMASAWV
jgi:transketolase